MRYRLLKSKVFFRIILPYISVFLISSASAIAFFTKLVQVDGRRTELLLLYIAALIGIVLICVVIAWRKSNSYTELLKLLEITSADDFKLSADEFKYLNKQIAKVMQMNRELSDIYVKGEAGDLSIRNEQELKTRGEKICAEIQLYIARHYDNVNLSLGFLADLYSLNISYLSVMFKKNMGGGLPKYIEKVRVEKAVEFLSKGEHTINEIAEKVGFGNALRFRRSFKKLMGVNPSEYIEYIKK